jgi:hypothetical protein
LTTRTRPQVVWATHPSSKSFTYPVIAPESFSDWDPVKETTTYTTPAASAFSSDFTSAVVAPETFSDWDPVLETGTYVKRQLVIPTDVPVVTDVPDLLEVFSDIATRQQYDHPLQAPLTLSQKKKTCSCLILYYSVEFN